jgi:antitoxin ChpS
MMEEAHGYPRQETDLPCELTPVARRTSIDCQSTLRNRERPMQIILRRIGNSTVAVLPPAVVRELGLAPGQSMFLETSVDGRIVLSRRRRYRLAELIAQCDPNAPPPADLQSW